MSQPKWSDDQRAAALELCREHGPRRAAELSGIPVATVGRWAKAAGLTGDTSRTKAATEVRQARWAERRATITDLFGEVAEEFIGKARAMDDMRQARDALWIAAVAVDKAQLLSGAATSRHEQLNAEKDRESIGALVDELAARRAQAG